MKKIKIFLMMLLAVLSFTACDDDDDSKQSIISEYSMNDQQVAAHLTSSLFVVSKIYRLISNKL